MHADTSLIEPALCCALRGSLSHTSVPWETFQCFNGAQWGQLSGNIHMDDTELRHKFTSVDAISVCVCRPTNWYY